MQAIVGGGGAAAPLTLVAVQEAWAYRCGLLYPFVWLWHQLQAALLRSWWCHNHLNIVGAHEPALLRVPVQLLHVVLCLLQPLWHLVPPLRRVLWDPKRRIAETTPVAGGAPLERQRLLGLE